MSHLVLGKTNPLDALGVADCGRLDVCEAGVSGLHEGGLYYRDGAGSPIRLAPAQDRSLVNIPEAPGDTVEFRGWASRAGRLVKAKVYVAVANTQGGTFTLAITTHAGNTGLNAATVDLGALAASTVHTLTLTGTDSDLVFAENGSWKVAVEMGSGSNDAKGIYVDLVFEVT